MKLGASTPKVPNGTYKFLGVEAEEKEGKKYPSISFSLEGLEGENKGKKYLLPLGFCARKWSVRKNNREFEWIPDNSWVALIRETPETEKFTAKWGGKLQISLRGEFYGAIIKSDGTFFGGTLYSVTPKLPPKRAAKKQLLALLPILYLLAFFASIQGVGFLIFSYWRKSPFVLAFLASVLLLHFGGVGWIGNDFLNPSHHIVFSTPVNVRIREYSLSGRLPWCIRYRAHN